MMSAHLKLDSILLATDLSRRCDAAFRYATAVAERFNARLYVLHVLGGVGREEERIRGRQARAEQRATEEMERLRRRLLERYDNYALAILPGKPADRILQKATELRADLIVLGTHDPNKARPAGNVIEQVCATSSCPVTCVPHEPEPGAEAAKLTL